MPIALYLARFLAARRHASAVICCRRVSVCVSVCYMPVLYRNGCADKLIFFCAQVSLKPRYTVFCRNYGISKDKATSLWNFVRYSLLTNLASARRPSASEINSAAGLLLIASGGDGRRGRSPTADRTKGPALCDPHSTTPIPTSSRGSSRGNRACRT